MTLDKQRFLKVVTMATMATADDSDISEIPVIGHGLY